jgi:hypothetical protein
MTKLKASITTAQPKLAPNTREQNTREQKKAKLQKIVDSSLMKHGIDSPRLAIEVAKEIGIELIIR